MAGGLSNQPRLVKGAFVDPNVVTEPPLILPFQFNPETLTRRRSVDLQTPRSLRGLEVLTPPSQGPGEGQTTFTTPETISMDIRLDATDAMERGDPVAGELGVLPALSTLELMITPRQDATLGGLLDLSTGFSFGDRPSTPVLLFVWGRQRVYPIRLTALDIQELEYNPELNPTRAVVGVSVQVLAGINPFHVYTQFKREIHASLNFMNASEQARSITNIS